MARDTKYVISLILAANASWNCDDYLICRRFGMWRRNGTDVRELYFALLSRVQRQWLFKRREIQTEWNARRRGKSDDAYCREFMHTLIRCMQIHQVLHLRFCALPLDLNDAQGCNGMINPAPCHSNFTPLLFGLQRSWCCLPGHFRILSGDDSSDLYLGGPLFGSR